MEDISYFAILPEAILCCFAVAIMLLDPLVPQERRSILGYAALAGAATALAPTLSLWGRSGTAFHGSIVVDNFATFFRVLFLFVVGLTILISLNFNRQENINLGEYFALLLFADVGMSLMASSVDLILTFLGLEILSISTYVLAGFKRYDVRSNESSLKYFILGSFSSAFLLYGIALLYGASGTTKFSSISASLASGEAAPVVVASGLGLLIVGFGFKVATVPFHIWTPDVYEGAPTPVTAFMSVGTKAAGFAAFLRVLLNALSQLADQWSAMLWLLAALTMVVGNIAALAQSNIKRMLAYSSVAHAGYMLVGLIAGGQLGISAVLFYLLAYTLMKICAFAVVLSLSGKGDHRVNLEDYAGMGFRAPFPSFALTVSLLSLIGIPLTGGFMGKLYLFTAGVKAGYVGLVIIAVLSSVVSVFYYVRPIVMMFMRQAADPGANPPSVPGSVRVALAIATAGILWLGLFPGKFLKLASDSILALK